MNRSIITIVPYEGSQESLQGKYVSKEFFIREEACHYFMGLHPYTSEKMGLAAMRRVWKMPKGQDTYTWEEKQETISVVSSEQFDKLVQEAKQTIKQVANGVAG